MSAPNSQKYFKDSALKRALVLAIVAVPMMRARYKVNRKLSVLEGTIRTFEEERSRSIRLNMPNYVAVHDASLFLLLFAYDLMVLRADFLFELRESRKNFYARQLCLLIYEGLDDLVVVFGKPLRKAVDGFGEKTEILKRLGQCTRKLSDLRKAHEVELSEIRHAVAAHRDHKAARQLQVILKMDHKRIEVLAADVDLALNEIVLCMTDVAQLMGDFRVVLRNIRIDDATGGSGR